MRSYLDMVLIYSIRTFATPAEMVKAWDIQGYAIYQTALSRSDLKRGRREVVRSALRIFEVEWHRHIFLLRQAAREVPHIRKIEHDVHPPSQRKLDFRSADWAIEDLGYPFEQVGRRYD